MEALVFAAQGNLQTRIDSPCSVRSESVVLILPEHLSVDSRVEANKVVFSRFVVQSRLVGVQMLTSRVFVLSIVVFKRSKAANAYAEESSERTRQPPIIAQLIFVHHFHRNLKIIRRCVYLDILSIQLISLCGEQQVGLQEPRVRKLSLSRKSGIEAILERLGVRKSYVIQLLIEISKTVIYIQSLGGSEVAHVETGSETEPYERSLIPSLSRKLHRKRQKQQKQQPT